MKEAKDPIVEIVNEIVSVVAGEDNYAYEMDLKDFLRQIYSALGIKEDFDSDSVLIEYEETPIINEKGLCDMFIEISLEPESKEQVFIESLLSKQEVKGLLNVGNTCYFNSAMQCLNASSDFVETIIAKKIIPSKDSKSVPAMLLRKNMYEFIIAMRNTKNNVHNPEHVLNAIRRKYRKFCGYHQQDSHELLITVIDRLIEEEQELYKAIKEEEKSVSFYDTTISKVFVSKLTNKISCMVCNSVYWVFDPSIAYSLPVSCSRVDLKVLRGKKRSKKSAEEVKTPIKELTVRDLLGEEKSKEKYKEVEINGVKYLEPQKVFKEFKEEEQIKTLDDCLDFFFQKEVLCEQNHNIYICPKCSGICKK
jgi:ubiquitin C-terminal hydrolase